jgi:hypothetical protein
MPASFGRLLESVEHGPAHPLLLDAPFAAGTVHLVFAAIKILGLAEEGQNIVPAPAGAAHLPPEIVITRLAAHVDHAVDRRRAAEHLAARIAQRR